MLFRSGIACSIMAFFFSVTAIAKIGVNRTSSFIGWATASYTAPEAENLRDTHSDKIIPNAGSVTFIYNEDAQIRTLYALWVRNKYTIHMVTNANSFIGDPYAADGYVLYDTKLTAATRSDGTRLFENNKNRPGYPAFTNKWTTYQIEIGRAHV